MKFNTLVRASGDNPNLLLGWLLETAKEVATGWGWGWRANIAAAGIRERVLKGQENGHTEIGYSRPEDSPRDYVSKVGHIIYCDQEWTGEGVTSVTKKFREATTELACHSDNRDNDTIRMCRGQTVALNCQKPWSHSY